MLTVVLFLNLAAVGETTCPKALVAVCDELAAGRPLRAAELAGPLARDGALAPVERRAAASIAVGAWLKDGSQASQCAARALLDDYLADPSLPRTAGLQRRRDELVDLDCDAGDDALAPVSARTPPVVTPAAAPPPQLVVAVTPLRAPARRPVGERRLAAGGSLLGLGTGFLALTFGAVGVMAHQLGLARDLTDRAREADRSMTLAEQRAFQLAFGAAEQARWVALGVGLTSAAAFAVGIPLTVFGRRLRLAPAVSREGAGLLLRGRF